MTNSIQIQIVKLQSDDSIVQVFHSNGSLQLNVYLFGATITHWSVLGQSKSLLFVSQKAVLDGSKPIRGGIPLVFPQFGPGPLQQHGFARVSR